MEEVKRWIEMSEDDLSSAESNIENGKYYVSAFLSQQTIEKALKAILLKKTGKIIKIHDLIILGRNVQLPKELIDKCKLISRVYIETRYGSIGEETPSQKFNKNDALKYLEISKEVLKWVRKNI